MTSLFLWQPLPSKKISCLRQNNTSLVLSARGLGKISNSLNCNFDNINDQLIPKHVAIIMDGNRRWAKARGLPVQEGHKYLAPNLKQICNVSSKLGIQVLTAFAFSTENWTRSKCRYRLEMRISIIGDRSKLPTLLQKRIELTEEATKANTGLHVVIALNYGGYYDILQATKSIASKVKDGLLQLEDINNDLFERELVTKCIKFAKPDLLIRTGGEQRISIFLLWQLAYSELYFTKTLFPDFGENNLKEAILSFQQRQRRFGGHTY
ncbi:(2Z,6Z)-farnesyl diphosphate synthase CPT6, chloroplastic-like [Nicotiana tabacum]|uniref:(2Z,6Z)-farnesyl diphosphate synthase CPT6, chloroplastic-like n=1 Tax=Nicotiana tabacum TaxID=4097 RepID=A0AC58SN48_TOBAC